MAFPHESQRNIMDCGATCLRNIAHHFGRSFPISYIRTITYTNREGANMLGLSRGAEAMGFRTLAIRVPLNKLIKNAPLPLIAHWDQNHFVVIYKFKGDKIYISDPALGLVKYKRNEFLNHWAINRKDDEEPEGICLLIEPTPNFKDIEIPEGGEERIPPLKFLWFYLSPSKKLAFQVMLAMLAGMTLQLGIPILAKYMIDVGINQGRIDFVWLILFAQLSLTFGGLFIELIRSRLLLFLSNRLNISLISDFFYTLMRLPMRYFDSRLTGDIMQRIQDHRRLEGFLTGTALNILFSFTTLVVYSIVLAFFSTSLLIIFAIGSVAYIIWITLFLKKREQLDHRRFLQAGKSQSKVIELVNGMQEIKLYNAVQQKRWSWERLQVDLFRTSLKGLNLEQIQGSGSKVIHEIKNLFITVIAATLVIDGKITLGTMLSVSYIIGQLNSPVLRLVGMIRSWQDAKISLTRISEIHLQEPEEPMPNKEHDMVPHSYLPKKHVISLKNVSFRYDGLSDFVLKNIDLEIPHGKVTAIVGSSGSGKTTLQKLLLRYYKPTEGTIHIGNEKLSDIDLYLWREACGVVMQEGFVFNDTIAGNIAVGEDNPDLQRLQFVTDIANIREFIESLPQGFATRIGQEGIGISTGQQQRMRIARAIYKDPQIILLDEATSSLDANNEREIIENLEQYYKGKTVVIIAHRLSTVKHADKVVVLEKGEIKEEGTHSTLVNQRGIYYELVKNQLELGN